MAIPTIVSVSPSVGHTGGFGLVEILGTGFQTWAIPPAAGSPSGDVWPTVDVRFGGVPGTAVAVVSSSRLFARVPSSPLPSTRPAFGEGAVDITVTNLDSLGVGIPGETATLAGGYTFQRAQLAAESDLNRLVRKLIRDLRMQVIPNVSITTDSDFDIDPTDMLNVVDVATVPALVIFGPQLEVNRQMSLVGTISTLVGAGPECLVRSAPDTDDLLFTFVGISNQKQEAMSLQQLVRQFFKKNRWLVLQRDADNAALGTVRYDMMLDAAGITFAPSSDQKSNLRSFSGSFVIRGFDHEDLAGFPEDDVVGRTSQISVVSNTSSPKDP